MEWKQGDKYYIHCRDYKISRSRTRGQWRYSAWHRKDLLGVFVSLDDAKRVVEIHEAGHFPHGGINYESATI